MSELVKINLIKKLKDIGIELHEEIRKIKEADDGWFTVYSFDMGTICYLTKEAYEELDKF